jgi:hypothetical protein
MITNLKSITLKIYYLRIQSYKIDYLLEKK